VRTIIVAAAFGGARPGPRLQPIGEIGNGDFGISVALSAHGRDALVGASADGGGVGAVWPFTSAGGQWHQQDRKLAPAHQFAIAAFGLRVALSADGDTALIGGPLLDGGTGAAWIYVRSGAHWHVETKLQPANAVGRSSFGEAVALSADGRTALVAGPTDRLGAGAAWIYVRADGRWRADGKLRASGEIGPGRLGSAAALSGDGRVAALGAPLDGNDVGAVWTFTRSARSWHQRGAKLVPRGVKRAAQFGSSVALTASGRGILVGAPVDRNDAGSAWAYTSTGADWRQQGDVLVPDGRTGLVQFGGSVALSGSGATALVGGATDNGEPGTGAVWVFGRKGSAWQQREKLTAHGERGAGAFGSSVAVSSDGSVAVVGGYRDDRGVGAAWTYRL
jgi:hypothetical protein